MIPPVALSRNPELGPWEAAWFTLDLWAKIGVGEGMDGLPLLLAVAPRLLFDLPTLSRAAGPFSLFLGSFSHSRGDIFSE
jgi:hypothetical protein